MGKVLVSLDDALLKQIDHFASSRGLSRSAYLAGLARRDQAHSSGQGKAQAARRALGDLDALLADASAGDSTASIRDERRAR